MKMYILVLNDLPLGIAANAACHAAVACCNNWYGDKAVREWCRTSFKKVTCQVTPEQFERAKEVEGEWIEMTESSMGGRVTALAFKPREEYHKHFKFLTMFGKGYEKKI